MTGALLEYRDCVDDWTFAIKFARLDFSGDTHTTEMLKELAHLIELEKYYKQKALINCWNEIKKQNNKRIEKLKDQLEQLKKKYKFGVYFIAGDKVKAIKQEINTIMKKNSEIDSNIAELREDRFLNIEEKKKRFRDLLVYLDFTCKSTYYKGENDVSVEIYESTLSDEQLYEKAKAKYDELKAKLDKEIESVKTNFLQSEEYELIM